MGPNIMLKTVILRRFGSSVAFSLAIGCPETMISRVIHHRYSLSPEEKQRWASALGCSMKIFDQEYLPRLFGNECAV